MFILGCKHLFFLRSLFFLLTLYDRSSVPHHSLFPLLIFPFFCLLFFLLPAKYNRSLLIYHWIVLFLFFLTFLHFLIFSFRALQLFLGNIWLALSFMSSFFSAILLSSLIKTFSNHFLFFFLPSSIIKPIVIYFSPRGAFVYPTLPDI